MNRFSRASETDPPPGPPLDPMGVNAVRSSSDTHDVRERSRADDGFTLIELMVVVLILGILLAIAIPTFLGARARAQERAAQSTLTNAVQAMRQIAFDNGRFPNNGAMLAQLPSIEPSIVWLDHKDSSSGPGEVSIDQDLAGAEVELAAASDSGVCFYVRVQVDGAEEFHRLESATCEAHDFQGVIATGW